MSYARALYNDILFSGSRRFAVCIVDPKTGCFSRYASVFYLKVPRFPFSPQNSVGFSIPVIWHEYMHAYIRAFHACTSSRRRGQIPWSNTSEWSISTHLRMYTYAYVCMHTCTCTKSQRTHMSCGQIRLCRIHVYLCVYMYVCIFTHVYTHIRTCMRETCRNSRRSANRRAMQSNTFAITM